MLAYQRVTNVNIMRKTQVNHPFLWALEGSIGIYIYIYKNPALAMVYGRDIEVVDPPIMNPEIMKGVAYIAQLVHSCW